MKYFYDFILICSAFFGVIMGMGFIFIGLNTMRFILILFGFIAVIVGLLSFSVLFSDKNE